MKSKFLNSETENYDKERNDFYDKLEKNYNFIEQS
jgi:hypothetical protein